MPTRKRNDENRGLPARWRSYHGAYYHQVPKRDGASMGRPPAVPPRGRPRLAYRTWAERLELQREAKTIVDLLDQ